MAKSKTTDRKGGAAVRVERVVRAPDWLLEQENCTQRQWRQRKRKDLKELTAAFAKYWLGAAYCPGNGEVEEIGKLLYALRQSHSVKNWGR